VFAAAVADWRVAGPDAEDQEDQAGGAHVRAGRNPDILATIAHRKAKRPKLVVGFAAETEKVVEHAKAKLKRKGCDWILANDVSAASGVMAAISTASISSPRRGRILANTVERRPWRKRSWPASPPRSPEAEA